MRIAILQPTFLPWAGWFDLADQVDQLVFLDDVAFSKQSWQQRNRLRTAKGLEYVSVPVRTSGRSGQAIADVELADSRFAAKLVKTVSASYARAAYFETCFPGFEQAVMDSVQAGRLCELNLGIIRWVFGALGMSTPSCMSSQLEVGGKRGDYVAAICAALSATEYLSPMGARDYLLEDHGAFVSRDIAVWLQNYQHPEYRQLHLPFIPFASVLDLIMNEGAAALEIIRSGRRPAIALEESG